MTEERPKKASSYTPQPEVPQDLMERFTTMLGVLTGMITLSEGARRLKLSRVQTQNLLHKALFGFVDGLSPKLPGPRPRSEAEQKLIDENARLRRQNDALQSRVDAIERMLGVASELLKGQVKVRTRTPRRKTQTATTETKKEEPEDDVARRLADPTKLQSMGVHPRLVAAVSGIAASTLRRWRRRGVPVRPRRRRPPLDGALAASVEQHVRTLRGLVGAESIRQSFRGVSRRQATAVKRETLSAMERERIQETTRVVVTTAGVVRGFDQMYVQTTEGQQLLLFSADGSVPYRTSVSRTAHYDERSVAAAVARDFEQNGAPLVWRADRHGSHDAPAMRHLLARHGVLRLYGPPRHPRFYGQMERQNREHRAWLDTLGVADPGELDEECARMLQALNGLWKRPTLAWRTAHDLWAERTELKVDRDELRDEVTERVARLASARPHDHVREDQLERLAIEQALTKRGFLRREAGGWC